MTIRREIYSIIILVFSCYQLSAQVDQELNKRISSIEESEISEQEKQTLIEDLYYLSINPEIL